MAFLTLYAFKVSQPLGDFFLTKITAEDLDKITYSSKLRPKETVEGMPQEFVGSQREQKLDKLNQIGRFIDSVEAAFPNNIILAANYLPSGELVEDENLRWTATEEANGIFKIIVPTRERLAAIVDGQHRLEGFKFAENGSRWNTELACAVYIDLPNPYQAYLFASINHNQTPVSKSLSYFLYGFNLDDELPIAWSPEKLAVFVSRQLNTEMESPFFRHIKVAPQIDKLLNSEQDKLNWYISTATIVEGILSLITTDAGRDRDELGKIKIKNGRNRGDLSKFKDESPLRKYFLGEKDIVVKKAVENFFTVAFQYISPDENIPTFVRKTIGVQAFFDVLKENLKKQSANPQLDISIAYFLNLLTPLFAIDFSDDFLMQSSAIGRSRLKNFMLYALGYRLEFDPRDIDKPEDQRRRVIKLDDKQNYDRLLA